MGGLRLFRVSVLSSRCHGLLRPDATNQGAEPPGTRRDEGLHFLTVSVDDFETPPPVAVMLTVVLAVTANVVIGTVADVDPAGTVTLVLAATVGFELVRVTRSPPAGAGPFRVTFAVDETPPFTPSGFNVSADSAAGLTVSGEVAVVPP